MSADGLSKNASTGGSAAHPICPICQGTSFGPAPNGRLSRRGKPPLCLSCRSLERHRAGRVLMESLRDRELFKDFRLLQFADDRIVAKGWFKSAETSILDAAGSLDPAAIARPDGAFDCIISSHIITKVADHRSAVRELVRVLSSRGLALLSYPLPGVRAETTDWGFPDPKQSGNFRILGEDFEPQLGELASETNIAAIRLVDPVTKDDDLVYLMSKGFIWTRRMLAAKLDLRLVG